jgi:hypothetical protein
MEIMMIRRIAGALGAELYWPITRCGRHAPLSENSANFFQAQESV